MSYQPDMKAAARRHLEAADMLDTTRRRDVAGYLYGIAAECGIKALMQQAGFTSPANGEPDPYYAHFPTLKSLLQNKIQGRNCTNLRRHLEIKDFLSGWDIRMRYARGSQIPVATLNRWKAQAKSVVGSIDT